MSSPQELAHFLSRCAVGDQAAFERLYRATSAQLFGVVLRIVQDRDLAGEVLQESYVKIWQHAGEFRPERATPITWMGAIARHQAIDLMRRSAERSAHTDCIEDLHWLADEGDGPPECVALVQGAQRLHRCLDYLPGCERRALVLAYFHGLTHEELARQLDKPLGTVKSWVRRGLLRLRGLYDAADHPTERRRRVPAGEPRASARPASTVSARSSDA